MLRGGQDGEAVIDGVSHARGVVHLHEVGDEARGDDDAQHHLGKLLGDGVGAAVGQCLLAPAHDGGGAHGAEGDAHSVAVGGDMPAGGHGGFIVLGHGVAHACPQVDIGGIGDDLGVDENMVGGNFGEGVFPQAAVGVIDDAEAGAGGAGGGDGGEGEEGAVRLLCQHLACVDGLTAAHGENHVGIGNLRQQHGDVLAGGLAAVPEGANDLYARLLSGGDDLVGCGSQGALTADDGGLFAVGRANGGNIVIGIGADGISGKKTLLHGNDSPNLSFFSDFQTLRRVLSCTCGSCTRPR